MDTLNDDVLDHIISEAIGNVHEWECTVYTRRTVTGVCKRWEQRVVNNPAFWTKIWFYRFTPVDSLKFCLKNNAGQPFVLVVDTRARQYMRNPHRPTTGRTVKCRPLDEQLSLLPTLLLTNMEHVKELQIFAENAEHCTSVVRALPKTTPSTVTEIVARAHTRTTTNGAPHALYGHPPQGSPGPWDAVRKVTLDGIHPMWAAPATTPNLTCLSMGNIRGLPSIALLVTLQAMPLLKTLKLQGAVCVPSAGAPQIVMSCITDFSIVYDEDESVHVLRHIAMPAVRRLQVDLWDYATFDALVTAWAPNLAVATEVDIAVGGMEHGNLPWFLAILASAEIVDLRRCGSDSLGAVKMAAQWNTCLLPRLAQLKVLDDADADDAIATFAAVPRDPAITLITGFNDAQTVYEYMEWRKTAEGVEAHIVEDLEDGIWSTLPNFTRY
ncbi:hypothetical protein DFH06DRAFT_1349957 [Mycena polygramma]|nr:hypothetical protein DFH06DRAFT_1349957 [Mycena polygramma]